MFQHPVRAALPAEFLARAHGHEPALMDDADAVRHFLGHAELVGGEKDRHPLQGALLEDVLHHARVMRIEAHHWLVDHKHLGIVQQRGGDGDPLAGAVGEAFHGLAQIRFEVEARDELARGGFDVLLRHAEQLPDETEEFPGRELFVEEREVGHVGEAAAHLQGLGLHIMAGHQDATGRGFDQAGDHLDRGGLAGGVGAQHGKELPALHREGHVVDGGEVAKALREIDEFDHGKRRCSGLLGWASSMRWH